MFQLSNGLRDYFLSYRVHRQTDRHTDRQTHIHTDKHEYSIVAVDKPQLIMRMCSPPQPAAVGGRLSEFVEGWKNRTNDPYVLSIVAKRYRVSFTSPPLLRETHWEIRYPQGREHQMVVKVTSVVLAGGLGRI